MKPASQNPTHEKKVLTAGSALLFREWLAENPQYDVSEQEARIANREPVTLDAAREWCARYSGILAPRRVERAAK